MLLKILLMNEDHIEFSWQAFGALFLEARRPDVGCCHGRAAQDRALPVKIDFFFLEVTFDVLGGNQQTVISMASMVVMTQVCTWRGRIGNRSLGTHYSEHRLWCQLTGAPEQAGLTN